MSHVISERGMSRDNLPETAVRAAHVRDDRRKERTIISRCLVYMSSASF